MNIIHALYIRTAAVIPLISIMIQALMILTFMQDIDTIKRAGFIPECRYHASGLGRFLAKDSVVDVNNTKRLNSYVYVQDAPVNLADPDGHRPIVSDDGGEIVLGYSSTEGHNHSSSTSVYRNGSVSVPKAYIKKATNSVPQKSKSSVNLIMLGLRQELQRYAYYYQLLV